MTVGEIVHYVSYGTPGGEYVSRCRAAVVTEVESEHLSLAVLNPSGMFFNQNLPHDPPTTVDGDVHVRGGTWHTLNECKES